MYLLANAEDEERRAGAALDRHLLERPPLLQVVLLRPVAQPLRVHLPVVIALLVLTTLLVLLLVGVLALPLLVDLFLLSFLPLLVVVTVLFVTVHASLLRTSQHPRARPPREFVLLFR